MLHSQIINQCLHTLVICLVFLTFVFLLAVFGMVINPIRYRVLGPQKFKVVHGTLPRHCSLPDDTCSTNSTNEEHVCERGKLTDGKFGYSNITCNGSEVTGWVGWKFSSNTSKLDRNLTISFEFEKDYVFRSFAFNSLGQQFVAGSVYVYTRVDIYLKERHEASDWKLVATKRHGNPLLKIHNESVNVTTSCVNSSRFAKVVFHVEKGKRIVLGEVQFEGEEGNMCI